MSKRKSNAVRPPVNGVVLPMKGRRQVQYRNVGQRGVVDPVASDATSSSNAFTLALDSGGNGVFGMVFAPRGLSGVNAAGTTNVSITTPHLPWLLSTSRNFLEYRVSRATLVVVGNVGSTSSGTVAVQTTTDTIDVLTPSAPGMGDLIAGGTSFALADLASSNKRIPMRVDSTWKRSTGVTSQLIAGNIVANATADELAFTAFILRVAGGPASSSGCLTTYIEYDVEFRGVASASFNA